jgi:subtilisin family serine protease
LLRRTFAAFLVCVYFLAAGTIPDHYIVELSAEPVAIQLSRQAKATGRRQAMADATVQQMRLAVRAGQQRTRQLVEQQQAEVLASTDTVLNALIVRIPDARAAQLIHLDGVAHVRPVREFKLFLDRAQELHKLTWAWAQSQYHLAGRGMKIAIIDSGVDTAHSAFQDSSLPMPEGFPRANTESDLSFTSEKVIVARSYAGLWSESDPDPSPRDHVGHGTAAAMAAAGGLNTGPSATISGVAPKAWLGSYKVFGSPGVNDGASEAAILKAIDDAVADGMDVLNLSFGSDLVTRLEEDTIVRAVEHAAALGVLVVVAAGNNGPDPGTIGSPASAPSAIAVGASASDRAFASSALVGNVAYIAVPGQRSSGAASVSGRLIDVEQVDQTGLACSALPSESLSGRIAFILRGNCNFEDKLLNAQNAGAIGALVYTHAQSPNPSLMGVGAASLPAEMVSNADGVEIKQRLAADPSLQAVLRFTNGAVTVNPNRLASFSTRGPNVDNTIKPDLVALGTNVYTATQHFDSSGDMFSPDGYISVGGTSFSSPIVAGAAALLKAHRPGLTSANYRSLLINSATLAFVQPGVPAKVQEAGAGVLDAYAALRSPIASSSTAISFGVGGPDPNLSRTISLTNTGTVSDVFSIQVVPNDPGAVPVVSSAILELAPGASSNLTVRLSANALDPGPREGYLVIRGTTSEVESRIPYWYAVRSDVPSRIVLLATEESGRRGTTVRGAAIFRVTDLSGVPIEGFLPEVTVLSGEGEVVSIGSIDSTIPGAIRLNVRLGLQPGPNVFRIQAGDVVRDFTVQGN